MSQSGVFLYVMSAWRNLSLVSVPSLLVFSLISRFMLLKPRLALLFLWASATVESLCLTH